MHADKFGLRRRWGLTRGIFVTNRDRSRDRRRRLFLETLEPRRLLDGYTPDRFEPNESLAAAADIGVGPGVHLAELNVHEAANQDWYRFELLRDDNLDVKLGFDVGAGDLSLEVTDAAGTVLATGTATSLGLTATLNGLSAGTYYVHAAGVGGATNAYSLAIEPAAGSATRVLYVNDAATAGDYYTSAVGKDANDGLTPVAPKATVQDVLADYDLGPTDLVVIDTGTYAASSVAIAAADEGAVFAGSPGGSNFTYSGTRWDLADVDNTLLYALRFGGSGGTGVYVRPGAVDPSVDNTIRGCTFSGADTAIRIDGGSGNEVIGNSVSGGGTYGIRMPSGGSATFRGNTLAGRTYGVYGEGSPSLTVQDNDIAAVNYGIRLKNGSLAASGNEIHDANYGVYLESGSLTLAGNRLYNHTSYGVYMQGGTSLSATGNAIHHNGTGLLSQVGNSSLSGNVVHDNNVGLASYGSIGPEDWSSGQANEVYNNATGIAAYDGATVRFNRVHRNATGIDAGNSTDIHHNVIYRNTGQGVLVDSNHDVAIRQNTMYTPAGDCVRVAASSANVSLANNILWTDSGYDLYVATSSQSGFASDYNNLFSTGSGKLVWWQKEFTDLFDWQVEAAYDLHSIGYTAPYGLPDLRDNPQFADLAGDDYHLTDAVSTSIDAGDPTADYSLEPSPDGGRVNLGAYGNTGEAALSAAQFLRIDYPEYYTDWAVDQARSIRWHTFDAATGDGKLDGDVDVDLYKVGTGKVADIAVVDAGLEAFGWTPADSGIVPSNLDRYWIRVTSVASGSLVDESREPFLVPAAGNSYYLNDASLVDDEYTTAAGHNRNPGKTPDAPKASLLPLLANYDLGPTDTVYIDTGTYVHVRNVVISGTPGVGDDQGAAFTGPANPAHIAELDRANPYTGATNLELRDADYVTIRRLTLTSGQRGLWADSGSNHLGVSDLVIHDVNGDGLRVDTGLPALTNVQAYANAGNGICVAGAVTAVDNVTARNNGGAGIYVGGNVSSLQRVEVYSNGGDGLHIEGAAPDLPNLVAYGNGGHGIFAERGAGNISGAVVHDNGGCGIWIRGGVASVTDSLVYNHNGDEGILLEGAGSVRIEHNVVYGNDVGISVYNGSGGTPAVVGHTDLALGRGNRVYGNSSIGIHARANVLVAGNTVYGQSGTDDSGIYLTSGADAQQNVVYDNYHGIRTRVHREENSPFSIEANRVFHNAATAITACNNSTVRNNVLYSNGTGIHGSGYCDAYGCTSFTGTVANNLLYGNATGISMWRAGTGAQFRNNTVYQNQDGGTGISVGSDSVNVVLRNNVVWAEAGVAISVHPAGQTGFQSDYNLLYATDAGQTGYWQGVARPTLRDWQNAAFTDQNSIAQDPLFVDRDGSDGVLGYDAAGSADRGTDDDFHLQSSATDGANPGSYHGGALAPVVDGVTGLPLPLTGTWTVDGLHSPGIDRGSAADSYANEPLPNGGYVNLGAYGNTAQASTSPVQYLLVTRPDGGEVWPAEQTFAVRWRSHDTGTGQVNLDLMQQGNPTPVTSIAAGEDNDGEYLWAIADSIAPATDYVMRVTRIDIPTLLDTSNASFEIAEPVHIYYVNDGAVNPAGDWTTAPGDDGHDGLTPASPKASIRAVIEAYELGPGDVIKVDDGTYALSANVLITAADAGLTIEGYHDAAYPTRQAVLNRGNTASGAYGFELNNADGVTLAYLVVTGANRGVQLAEADNVTLQSVSLSGHQYGIYAADGSDSDGLTVLQCTIANNTSAGLYLYNSNDRPTVSGSRFYGNAGNAIYLRGSTNASVTGNTVYGNTGNYAIQLEQDNPGAQISANEVYGNKTGIYARAAGGSIAVSGNTIHDNSVAGVEAIYGGTVVTGNTVYGQAGTDGKAIYLTGGASATQNVVYDNYYGIYTRVHRDETTPFLIEGNRVYHNISTGITGNQKTTAHGNVVYGNGGGINMPTYCDGYGCGYFTGTVANNLVYGNRDWGIITWGSRVGASFVNNTVYQEAGNAMWFDDSADVAVRNNILWVGSGAGVAVDFDSESGFSSDYNLFYTPGGGSVGYWGGRNFTSLADWRFEVGQDAHSRFADPEFVDPDGLDGVWGFSVQPVAGTVAIIDDGDAGFAATGTWTTMASGFNGDALRTTGAAWADSASWTFTGLTPGSWYDVAVTWPVALGDTDAAYYSVFDGDEQRLPSLQFSQRSAPNDFSDAGADWERLGFYYVTGDTLVVKLWNNDASSDPALADAVRIERIEGDCGTDDDFRVRAGSPSIDAGRPADAFALEPAPNGGRVNQGHTGNTAHATSSPAELVQVLSPNGLEKLEQGQQVSITWRTWGLAAGLVDIDLMEVGNPAPVQSIAAGASDTGVLAWTVPGVEGDHFLIRITSREGAHPHDLSDDPFLITNAGTDYYVNVWDDTDFSDNERTTAAGDNLNSGKRPAAPMASLVALLAAYDLDPGDVVHVETGTYRPVRNLALTSNDSGARIEGPVQPGHAAVLDRGNTATNVAVVELAGGDDVTLDHLTLIGAYYGVFGPDAKDSDRVTVSHCDIYANAKSGARIEPSHDRFTIADSAVHGHSEHAIYLRGAPNARITGNTVYGNTGNYAIYLQENNSGAAVSGNEVYGNKTAIYGNGWNGQLTISGNTIHDNSGPGVEAAWDTRVTENTVYGHAAAENKGIYLRAGADAAENVVFDNYYGIYTRVHSDENQAFLIEGNRVYHNTATGITGNRNTTVRGNVVYGNSTGINLPTYCDGYGCGYFTGNVANNLVYGNTNCGISTWGSRAGASFVNNTVWQQVGNALWFDSSADVVVRNNILWTDSGRGVAVDFDAEAGFSSDYNLFYTPGAGSVGYWGGRDFASLADWQFEVGQDAHSRFADPQFADPDGADGVLGFSLQPMAGTVAIIDDGDAGFAATGTWTTMASGFNSDALRTTGAAWADSASWTFTGLTPGSWYDVAVTWPAALGDTDEAYYRVYDGDKQRLPARPLSQRSAPNDFSDAGADWERLGFYYVAGDTLVVKLWNNDSASDPSLADAVRIERIEGDHGLDDDFRVRAGSPSIDAGRPADAFALEPAPNGGRVNQGHTGNTPQATSSPADGIQVLSPNGLEKYEQGQQVTLTWRVYGLEGLAPPQAAYRQAVAADVPLADWRLGEASGTTAVDAAGSGYDGTYVNGVTLGAPGILADDTAVVFDGDNDRIDLPAALLNGRADVSLEFWLRTSHTGAQAIVSGANSGNDNEFLVYLSSNTRLQFNTGESAGSSVGWDLPPLSGERWHHFVIVRDATQDQASLYLDGIARGSVATTLSALQIATGGLVIGQEQDSVGGGYVSTEALRGTLDEVAFYPGVLSAGQVLAHYLAGQTYGTVDVDLISQGTGGEVLSIAAGVPNNGELPWQIPGSVPQADDYLIRVTSNQAGWVQDESDAAFLITNAGTDYYVNLPGDTDFTDNEYTATAGDNLNSGKTPEAPMASLVALLAAYDLDPDDVVHVETGTYQPVRNLTLTANDSGVRIEGPTQTGHAAVLDRGNTASSGYTIELAGGDDITLDHLTLTGAYYGVYGPSAKDSDRVTISHCELYGNAKSGVRIEATNDQFTVSDSTIHGHSEHEIYLRGAPNARITGNTVYGNTGSYALYLEQDNPGAQISANKIYANKTGIYARSAGGSITVSGNTIHDNSVAGVEAGYSGTLVTGNTLYGQSGTDDKAIYLWGGAGATQNQVYGNYYGIYTRVHRDETTPFLIEGNRVFHNTANGITGNRNTTVRGNVVYSNSGGIHLPTYCDGYGCGYFTGTVVNNLVYGNTNWGIDTWGSRAGASFVNNTVYQEVGNALSLTNSTDVAVRNNLLWVDAGYDLYVATDSQAGFKSDYNLFHQGADPNAHVGYWNGAAQDLLSDWQTASGQDAHAVEAAPGFVDINGPDNVLGYTTTGGGYDGGPDDNFGLARHSAAIDRADAWTAPATDIRGQARRDDPGMPNQGSPDYAETDLDSSLYAARGVAKSWRSNNTYWTLSFPTGFTFPFYEGTYSSVRVSTEGLLYFSGSVSAGDGANSTDKLIANRLIAPLWDNLKTNVTGDDIFVDTSVEGEVAIRWNATSEADNSDVNMMVVLYSDGRIRFDYGPGNTNLTPTVGISRGDGRFYVLSMYDGDATLTDVNSVQFALAAGLTYTDIGAYEFLGDSNDATSPQVVATVPAEIESEGTCVGLGSGIQVQFTEELDPIDALAPANYELRRAANGVFGDADDVLYTLTPSYQFAPGSSITTLTLDPQGPPVVSDLYRLTVRGSETSSVHDVSGNRLDGDRTGTEGPDYVRTFRVIETLIVTQFTWTASGFVAEFNRALELSVLNLYDGAAGGLGPADAVLRSASGAAVAGSIVSAASGQQITFVKSGGPLAAGSYTAPLTSGAAAFRDPAGSVLDGERDGIPGGDFTARFTVAASGDRVVSIPDVARGAGQSVNVPNTLPGLPIRLSDAAGVTSLAVDVRYDPALLSITAATLAAGVPADWNVTLDTGTAGVAKIDASGRTALSGTNVEIVRLTAAVPGTAAYGAIQSLRLENVSLNGGGIGAVGDVAVHKAVYLGDTDGSGIHSSADAFLTVQAALGLASGFAAHAWTDPRIVGDADGSGVLSAADAFLIVQEGLGLSEPFVPDNPHIGITPVGGGVDPQFRIGADLVPDAAGWVSVPVKLAIEPAATNVGAFDFDLFFDPARLTIQLPGGISAGADTAGWAVTSKLVAPGQLRVGMVSSNGPPLAPGLREIARLQFRVEASAGSAAFRRLEDDRRKPALQTSGYAVGLDIEPVDARAGGYTWTDVDGSVRVRPAERTLAGATRDRVWRDADAKADLLENVLAELAYDIASAWR